MSKFAKNLHHCISRHHISQVELGIVAKRYLFSRVCGKEIQASERANIAEMCECINTMIICSYTLSEYRNGFYGAALAQGDVSLPRSTLIQVTT